jgi:hypothetical protein
MTPLAVIANEPWRAVRADSPIRAISDLVERWRTDPQSVSISLGSTRGGNTHLFLGTVARRRAGQAQDAHLRRRRRFRYAVDGRSHRHDVRFDRLCGAPPQSGKLRIIAMARRCTLRHCRMFRPQRSRVTTSR